MASALSQGRRDSQEDSLASDFQQGSEHGFAVIADGMGGHAAGDIASQIVVTEVFSELKFRASDVEAFEAQAPRVLSQAAALANDCLRAHGQCHPGTKGMGATLIAPVFFGLRLHWISIGDSPLYLFRANKLIQLNEDHSMAPEFDRMVMTGLIASDDAQNHPDRNCLTSVIGGGEIARVDCPTAPFRLEPEDIILAATDGVQFLSDDQIAYVLEKCQRFGAKAIAEVLMDALEILADPDQDNVALTVIKLEPVQRPVATPKRDDFAHTVVTDTSFLHVRHTRIKRPHP